MDVINDIIIVSHVRKIIGKNKLKRFKLFVFEELVSKIRPFCTSGGNRTHTLLPELDFESSASTNSATEAMEAKFIKSFVFNHFYQNIIKFEPQ